MRNLWFIFILIIAFMACSDDKDVLAPVPNDVTLNELSWSFYSCDPGRRLYFESGSQEFRNV